MVLQNDKQIIISAAGSRKATLWQAETMQWSEFIDRLKKPSRTLEPLEMYLKLPKSKQDDLKDVGGYVGGTLRNGRRLEKNVVNRYLIALDLDNIPSEGTNDVLLKIKALGCAFAVYSTRKHEPIRPRLRVLIPTFREMTVEEYEPTARKVAEMIGIDWCDPTTFQASRLMYWPSVSANAEYVFKYEDKPFLDVDAILKMYRNWQDHSEWPTVPGEMERHRKLADKQEDPTTKKGVIGAFCKVYSVYDVLDKFLSDVYSATDDERRFTYAGGSTFGGAVVYGDGLFLYSHHATDPAGGRLCNAFDLVRIHKFSHLDEDSKDGTPVNKLPSYTAMSEFAVADNDVVTLLNKERFSDATADFSCDVVDSDSWFKLLQTSPQTGMPAKTIDNVSIILDHDPNLAGRLAYDEFANRWICLGSLPWNTEAGVRIWDDTDDSGLRQYIEKVYGITGKDRIYDATTLCVFKHKFNPVQDYLKGLRWDNIARLDTLIIDYLGAEDNEYTRAVTRKVFVAAIARAMKPGTKFDVMPVIIGPQGIGKSTLIRLLGKEWYSDNLVTFEGKEAAELVQGNWIIEVGELSGLSKSETNTVKQFLSRVDDQYRQAYGRRTSRFPRQCVFFGTTNDDEFLKDRTGNRRFWPIETGLKDPTKSVFDDLPDEVDQIWAEAFVYWQFGEPLYLSKEIEKMAQEEQKKRIESSAKEGAIIDFILQKVPADWNKYTLEQRQAYLSFEHKSYSGELITRDRICAAEIWVECFRKDIANMKRWDALEINGILSGIEYLEKLKNDGRFGPHGKQKGYRVIENKGVDFG